MTYLLIPAGGIPWGFQGTLKKGGAVCPVHMRRIPDPGPEFLEAARRCAELDAADRQKAGMLPWPAEGYDATGRYWRTAP